MYVFNSVPWDLHSPPPPRRVPALVFYLRIRTEPIMVTNLHVSLLAVGLALALSLLVFALLLLAGGALPFVAASVALVPPLPFPVLLALLVLLLLLFVAGKQTQCGQLPFLRVLKVSFSGERGSVCSPSGRRGPGRAPPGGTGRTAAPPVPPDARSQQTTTSHV